MRRTILHIDLDAFFVSVELLLRPDLAGKPVVVGGNPDGRGVVASASYEARAYGLRAGMPLGTARRLCPQAVFLQSQFARCQQASADFLTILGQFSPFREPVGIDEAYLDLTGFESLYGPARQAVIAIRQRIRQELGLAASVGIAGCKVVAKVASDLSKPDGLLEVAPGEEAAFLAPLPVARLPGVGPRTEHMLKGLGVATVGDLALLPMSTLQSRLGERGLALHSHARGCDDSPVQARGAARSISRETTLAEDSLDRTLLSSVLRYLAERVGAELRRQGKLAGQVSLKLRYHDFDTTDRQAQLRPATDADHAIFEAGQSLMARQLARRHQRVRLLGISVAELRPLARQLGLWENPSTSSFDRLRTPSGHRQARDLGMLDRAVDRVRLKYGFGAIQTGRTLQLRPAFGADDRGYRLSTPALSR